MFAQRFCRCNPGVFGNPGMSNKLFLGPFKYSFYLDACYILSFSIIMLNTTLHNPNVKDKVICHMIITWLSWLIFIPNSLMWISLYQWTEVSMMEVTFLLICWGWVYVWEKNMLIWWYFWSIRVCMTVLKMSHLKFMKEQTIWPKSFSIQIMQATL